MMQLTMRDERGASLPVSADRWLSDPEPADLGVLDHVRAPVLDIGCGPGRHVAELARRGLPALGIDITEAMLCVARQRGATVLRRSVFARVPAAGRWGSALLLDGNIGIGGDPPTLLERTRALLDAEGVVLVELDPSGSEGPPRRVRLELDGRPGPAFRWASLAVDGLDPVARAAGFVVSASWWRGSRYFARLEQARRV
jgi:SAM-dependent methyltransferase